MWSPTEDSSPDSSHTWWPFLPWAQWLRCQRILCSRKPLTQTLHQVKPDHRVGASADIPVHVCVCPHEAVPQPMAADCDGLCSAVLCVLEWVHSDIVLGVCESIISGSEIRLSHSHDKVSVQLVDPCVHGDVVGELLFQLGDEVCH